jgi:hypothetical protein
MRRYLVEATLTGGPTGEVHGVAPLQDNIFLVTARGPLAAAVKVTELSGINLTEPIAVCRSFRQTPKLFRYRPNINFVVPVIA